MCNHPIGEKKKQILNNLADLPPSVTNSLCERKFAKIQAGYKRIFFLQKYERYTGKNTSADSQIFHFSKWQKLSSLVAVLPIPGWAI